MKKDSAREDSKLKKGSSDGELFSNLCEYVRDYVLRAVRDEYLAKRAGDVIERALQLTGHLPSIHGVSRGAGYCSFYARLSELIGARGYIASGLSGKGRNEHKVLALASLEHFSGWSRHLNDVDEAIESAINELDGRGLLIFRSRNDKDKEIDELRRKTRELLLRLCEALPMLCSTLGIGIKGLVPIVEQQLLDYKFYLRGSPDLILEDKVRRKAIVVEWKTSKYTPLEYEEAQAVAYAILEARRLGCKTLEQVESYLLGDVENEFRDVKVLPIIVRPGRGELRPHPVLAPMNKREERLKRFKEILYNVILEAQHLTFLLTNIRQLLGIEPKDFLIPLPESPNKSINVLTHTPRQLKSGRPISRDRYPCISVKRNCQLYDACGFYFGRPYGEKEDYEAILWGLRYDVIADRERSLVVYRALQNIFESYKKIHVIEELKEGSSFRYDMLRSISTIERKEGWHGRLEVVRWAKSIGEETITKRVDVIDEVKVTGSYLRCRRMLRDHEKTGMPQVIVEGRNVLLTILDADDPLLSIKLFGRVDEVNIIEGERGTAVEYILGVPSKILEFQKLIFSRYLSLGKDCYQNLLMVEVDVDLTHMDLEALDALQRVLREREELREAALMAKEAVRDVVKEDFDATNLRKLLKQLIGGSGHRLQG